MFDFRWRTRESNFTGENGLLRDVSRVSNFGCLDVNIRLMRKKDKKNVFPLIAKLIFMGTALIYLHLAQRDYVKCNL